MARSDQLLDHLRRRLDEVVRPVTPGSLATPAPEPVRTEPDEAWWDEVDQASIRTLLRPAAPSAPGPAPHLEATIDTDNPAPPFSPEPASPPTTDPPRPQILPRPTGLTFDRRHLVVVVVLLSVAVLVGGWAVLRARDHAVGAEPVALDVTTAAPSGSQPAAGPASTSPAASPTPTPERITVHVVGAVHKPGLVRLPDGARVADAIKAAGGLLDKAVPGRLNLAQRLQDGEQVFLSDSAKRPSEVVAVGAQGSSPGASSDGSGAGQPRTVNLNTATQAELESLPGVGPATAQAILAWRREHGRFTRIEELQEVDGIGPKTFARLSDLVTV